MREVKFTLRGLCHQTSCSFVKTLRMPCCPGYKSKEPKRDSPIIYTLDWETGTLCGDSTQAAKYNAAAHQSKSDFCESVLGALQTLTIPVSIKEADVKATVLKDLEIPEKKTYSLKEREKFKKQMKSAAKFEFQSALVIISDIDKQKEQGDLDG